VELFTGWLLVQYRLSAIIIKSIGPFHTIRQFTVLKIFRDDLSKKLLTKQPVFQYTEFVISLGVLLKKLREVIELQPLEPDTVSTGVGKVDEVALLFFVVISSPSLPQLLHSQKPLRLHFLHLNLEAIWLFSSTESRWKPTAAT
jgi:hypothetical protein